jgi:hypothetical protein
MQGFAVGGPIGETEEFAGEALALIDSTFARLLLPKDATGGMTTASAPEAVTAPVMKSGTVSAASAPADSARCECAGAVSAASACAEGSTVLDSKLHREVSFCRPESMPLHESR